ncbi:hypothetical protein PWT90_10524 [Aphanocladium album]|nr:hypothetical protein PWT90_10524 [Aphanocladium album]
MQTHSRIRHTPPISFMPFFSSASFLVLFPTSVELLVDARPAGRCSHPSTSRWRPAAPHPPRTLEIAVFGRIILMCPLLWRALLARLALLAHIFSSYHRPTTDVGLCAELFCPDPDPDAAPTAPHYTRLCFHASQTQNMRVMPSPCSLSSANFIVGWENRTPPPSPSPPVS